MASKLSLRKHFENLVHELIVTSSTIYYAAGTLEGLESYFSRTPIRDEYLIVDSGALAGTGAESYKLI